MRTMMAEVRELARKYPNHQILVCCRVTFFLLFYSRRKSTTNIHIYFLKVTGHSLGGSFAALAAAFIARHILPSRTERRWRLQLMTFGQPRTGDRQWADAMNKTVTDSNKRSSNMLLKV
jgi:predicted lipase